MKIAFSTPGVSLDAPLDMRFGRAPGFLIYDTADGSHKFVDNVQNLNAAQGAGIQAAQTVARAGVDCVVTGHCGPKAFTVLSSVGIKVYNVEAGSVAEALELYSSGDLQPAESADVEGHWV